MAVTTDARTRAATGAARVRGGGRITAAAAALALGLAGCSGEEPGSQASAPPDHEAVHLADLAREGEQVYRSVCIACHAFDPAEAGAVGPAVAGSSLELLRAKVLRNEYPPGYTPKRETRAMVPLPHLEPELPALAAYLESVGRASADAAGG